MEKIRILVIDDEAEVCSMLVEFFTREGYSAQHALNGKQALELIQSYTPHFVTLDIMMPGMSGIEVLREIRNLDKTVSVIMISGMHDLGMAKEAMKLGAIDYIPKPIKLDDLSEFLKREVKKFQSSESSEKIEALMQSGDWD